MEWRWTLSQLRWREMPDWRRKCCHRVHCDELLCPCSNPSSMNRRRGGTLTVARHGTRTEIWYVQKRVWVFFIDRCRRAIWCKTNVHKNHIITFRMSANLINFVTHITSGSFARVVRRRKKSTNSPSSTTETTSQTSNEVERWTFTWEMWLKFHASKILRQRRVGKTAQNKKNE